MTDGFEPKFVGQSRQLLVDGLLKVFDQVSTTGKPVWVSLEAPTGWGKTRVAREFYTRLATDRGRQSEPRYWPDSILEATREDLRHVNTRRKRVYPEQISHAAGSLPNWMWWGIACFQRGGVESAALMNDLTQLQKHAVWWEAAWRAQVTFGTRHASSLTELRELLSQWAEGEALSKAAETLLGSAVPGIGLIASLAAWTRDRASAAGEMRGKVRSEETVYVSQPSLDLDDTVALLKRLAVPGLPMVVFVEDLHFSDKLLVELLMRLLQTDSAVMIVTTIWPGHIDDDAAPERRLAGWAKLKSPGRVLRVRHDMQAGAPMPFEPAAGLRELEPADLKEIVRFYFPRATENALHSLVERYPNPLPIELVCLQQGYHDDFPDGDLDLSAEEVARLPRDVEGLYELAWLELPESVRQGLALAAISVPAAIDPVGGDADARWHPSVLSGVAKALYPDDPGRGLGLEGEPAEYSWGRAVDMALRQFHEPVQRNVADREAESIYTRTRRAQIYASLATRMLDGNDAELPRAVAEHRARTILTLQATGYVTDPRPVIEATLTLIAGLRRHPREHHRILDLIERAKAAVTDRLAADDSLFLTLRQNEAAILGQMGRLDDAIRESREVYEARSRVLEPDAEETLESRHSMAGWLGQAGRLEEATSESRAVLADRLRVLGPDHRDTLRTRHNLAFWLGEAGQVEEAILETRALIKDRERALGFDDHSTLTSRNSLAYWLGQAGRIKEAIDELHAVLDLRLSKLGPDDPATLTTRHNLAGWHGRLGQVDRAITETQAVVGDRIRILGPDHPDTLTARNNVAYWLGQAGRLEEAMTEARAVLADRIRILEADHPDTLNTRHSLAVFVGQSGRMGDATAALTDLIDDQTRVLGPDHPATLTTRGSHAFWLAQSGRIIEATTKTEAVLADRIRILGPHHPDTLQTRHNLASWLVDAGRAAEAEEAFRAVLADRIRILGPDHPDTLKTRHGLASYLGEAGRVQESIDESRAVLADRVRILGADHPDTLTTHHSLAGWLGQSGRIDEAIAETQAVLEDRIRILGPDHRSTRKTRHNLAIWQEQAGPPAS